MKQRGFTLVELMVVVAIIGILAAIAVFTYTRSVKRARVSEVRNVMAEFKLRQEKYYVENDEYLATGVDDADIFPTPSAGDPTSISSPPTEWDTLGINLGKGELWCGFVSIVGEAGDATTIGSIATLFGFTTAPAEDWYYVVADCPFNDSYYLVVSNNDAFLSQSR